jgi:hypothetical protein
MAFDFPYVGILKSIALELLIVGLIAILPAGEVANLEIIVAIQYVRKVLV